MRNKEAITIDSIRHRVVEISEIASDDEHAHSLEDDLWNDVLQAIADGAPDSADLATEALKTNQVKFHRWYA
jgi:hypothetical protein